MCVCLLPDAAPALEAFLRGDFEAVLRDQRVLDVLAGDGSWAGEDVEAQLEGRLSLYLIGGAAGEQANR